MNRSVHYSLKNSSYVNAYFSMHQCNTETCLNWLKLNWCNVVVRLVQRARGVWKNEITSHGCFGPVRQHCFPGWDVDGAGDAQDAAECWLKPAVVAVGLRGHRLTEVYLWVWSALDLCPLHLSASRTVPEIALTQPPLPGSFSFCSGGNCCCSVGFCFLRKALVWAATVPDGEQGPFRAWVRWRILPTYKGWSGAVNLCVFFCYWADSYSWAMWATWQACPASDAAVHVAGKPCSNLLELRGRPKAESCQRRKRRKVVTWSSCM